MKTSHDLDDDVLSAPAPRHLDLARSLMQDIRNGQPAIGELLPTEAELCAKWGLSRYTVRQAIQKLCALGLVTRQAGVGTTVVASRPQSRYTQSMDNLSDLVRYAQGTRFRMTGRQDLKAGAEHAQLLRGAAGGRWLHLNGTRLSADDDGEPIALVDIYVDAAYGDLPGISPSMDVPVYTLIEERYGIKVTRVEQEIQGVLIEGAAADLLQVPRGSPGLRIIRTYFVRDRVIEVTTGMHPASRFSYSMSFQLSSSAM
ncbi:GntR family transcriptional regulator [Pseudomonas sp. MT3]|uniref:GntR family transcriptional regulator n=1 Tax=Pseudomonas sp. ATCC 13867 TaxID=1294143 RepID=UPI0002C4E1B2|nr:GntR family transcriptional regulator [Pseudomonas sp. ATCC 13867]AGI24099.1 GntR family transcriptional regulator [Pseudomonas sp. ATCC 13867]RFQ23103.1 GntR family transcriptional regulator [Pseudomonas sp. ATCC 13867]